MEHLRDEGHLDATRTVEVKSKELVELETEYQHLSSAYYDIETKLPQGLPGEGRVEELKTQPFLDANILTFSTSFAKERKMMTYLAADLHSTLHPGKLKDIFTRYVSCQNCTIATRMELQQFHRFLQDSNITPALLSRAKADVLFFQDNTGKNITFWRWIEVLAAIAKGHYRSKKGLESLTRLLSEVILASPSIRSSDLPLAQWNVALATANDVISAGAQLIESIFRVFHSRHADAKGKISLNNYLVFVGDCHIVPELTSKVLAVRVFRAALADSFAELATVAEFQKTCCYLAFLTHKGTPGDALTQFLQWLSLSAQKLRVVELEAGRDLRLD